MKLKEIMMREILVISPGASLREAARKMEVSGLCAIPVCDGRKIIGMITDRDICLRAVARGLDPEQTIVNDIMTSPVVWCFEDCDTDEAARMMEDRQISRLVVVDREKKLVGMIGLDDLTLVEARLPGEEAVAEPPQTVH